MLNKITLLNFRNIESVTFDLKPGVNYLEGQNGAGKTTIKEAICFTLTDTDSQGNRNPEHLVSRGKEVCQTVLESSQGKLTRTLQIGRKTVLEVWGDIRPSKDKETFLAAFIPGYFMGLKSTYQLKILDDLLPKIERQELLLSLCHAIASEEKQRFPASTPIEITPQDFAKYNFDKRLDITLSNVTADRRKADQLTENYMGQLEVLWKVKEPVNEWPQDIYTGRLEQLEILRKQWHDYNFSMRAWEQTKERVETVKKTNELITAKKEEIKKQIEKLQLAPHPAYQQVSEKIKELQKQMLPEPIRPEMQRTVEVEFCPTCGQAVTPRHRETVKKENERLLGLYNEELNRIRKHNMDIIGRIKQLNDVHEEQKKTYLRITSDNDKISRMKKSLQDEHDRLVFQDIPNLGIQPERPTQSYDEAEYESLKKEYTIYLQKRAVYESELNRYKKTKETVSLLESQVKDQKVIKDRLEIIETAMKKLPQEELRLRTEQLSLGDGIQFLVDEAVHIFVDSIPYEMLSTGQRMKVDIRICQKVNALMTNPINMIFIDNADLVDNIEELKGQVFIAKVTEGPLCVR